MYNLTLWYFGKKMIFQNDQSKYVLVFKYIGLIQ